MRPSQKQCTCCRDEDSFLAIQPVALTSQNVYFGKSAGKAGNHWGGGRLKHQTEDQCSWEDLDDLEYNENNPAEIYKEVLSAIFGHPTAQQ